MMPENDYFLDITNEVCPLTFVRTKLLLEKMKAGQILVVRLMGEEPLKNVPASVREMGHVILSCEPESPMESNKVFVLHIRKEPLS